jgi:recombination protein RecA
VEEQVTARNELLQRINKKYGEGTIIKGSQLKGLTIPRVSTGSLSFDLMLGGGWPVNHWNEIIGQESAGKTVMAMKTVAANQALNPKFEVLWIAAEDLVPDWAEAAGMDLDRVDVIETNIMEAVYGIISDALEARSHDMIVLDSLPALVPGDEAEKEMHEPTVALGAKLSAKFFRKTNKTGGRSLIDANDRPWTGIVINQWRERIVMMGDPRTTPGGKAKNYEYFTRVEVSRSDWILGPGKRRVGLEMKAKTLKNKVAPVNRVGIVDFYFDACDGFVPGEYDTLKELFNIAVEHGIIEQGGGYYKFLGERLSAERGKLDALQVIRSTPDLFTQIESEIRRSVLVQF